MDELGKSFPAAEGMVEAEESFVFLGFALIALSISAMTILMLI